MNTTETRRQGQHDILRAGVARCEPLEERTLFAGTPLYITETTTPAGLLLSIEGTRGNDRISVVAYGDTLMLANKGGWSLLVPNHYAQIDINAARGNDVVIVDSSVTTDTVLRGSNGDDTIKGGAGDDRLYGGYGRDRILGGAGDDTIVTIGDSVQDRVTGGDGFDSFWTDSNKSEVITDATADEWADGGVNRVAAFHASPGLVGGSLVPDAVGTSRDLGAQDLPDPKAVIWRMVYSDFSNRPLFPVAGPQPTDIRQGLIGDCYFLAPMAALAQENPELIRRLVIELGDGTYAVRFHRDGAPVYLRVDDDLPTWPGGTTPVYAELAPDGAMWVAVIEKAYANFRRNEGTYHSIHLGWMYEGFEALGFPSEMIHQFAGIPLDLHHVRDLLDAGAAMTWSTRVDPPPGLPLVSSHVYAIAGMEVDADGEPLSLRLLNPWGIDGVGDDGADDGYVTLTAAEAILAFARINFALV